MKLQSNGCCWELYGSILVVVKYRNGFRVVKLLSIGAVVSLMPPSRGMDTGPRVGALVALFVLFAGVGSIIIIPDSDEGIALGALLVTFVLFVGDTDTNTVGRTVVGVLVTFGAIVGGGILGIDMVGDMLPKPSSFSSISSLPIQQLHTTLSTSTTNVARIPPSELLSGHNTFTLPVMLLSYMVRRFKFFDWSNDG